MSSISNVCRGLQNQWWHFSGQQRALDAKVSQYVQQSALQLGTSFGVTGAAVAFFGVLPWSVLIGQGIVVIQALRIALSVSRYALERSHLGTCKRDVTPRESVSGPAHANLVNTMGTIWPNIWLHELGHAAAGHLCKRVGSTVFKVIPFDRGAVTVGHYGLSAFGNVIGLPAANALIALGGPIASVTVAMADIAVAHTWTKPHPHVAATLRYHAISMIAAEVIYGIESILAADLSSDLMLAKAAIGISPALVLFLLVAIPLAQYLLLQRANPAEPLNAERRWQWLRK